MHKTQEHKRLESYRSEKSKWKKWGPYLSDRAWGTVREDYSDQGDVWQYFSHEMAQFRAFRWNEDGIGGICDRNQRICFAISLWNGKDPCLKERYFGLNGPEGNHGEDVKEYYFHLDNTPTHSYMKMLYKYPQEAFPYQKLQEEARKRSRKEAEYELHETGVFDQARYFDLVIEFAKADEEDILIRYSAINRGPDVAELTLLPTVWLRNTWSWGYEEKGATGDEKGRPFLRKGAAEACIEVEHPAEKTYHLYCEGAPEFLFTENETNHTRLDGSKSASPYTKDAFHRYVVSGEKSAICPEQVGTKAAALYRKQVNPGETWTVQLRLSTKPIKKPFLKFEGLFQERKKEADAFYGAIQPKGMSEEHRKIQRSAFAGLLWSKQFYYLDMEQWRKGDPLVPLARGFLRNRDWAHLTCFDLLLMPDKWEYPYFCSWDLSFHCIPMLLIDPDFAKRQIELLTREWYLHPNGQLPANEWNFSDVNPPVLAWSTWRAYKIDEKMTGKPDRDFLKTIFNKLLLNFTWWVNQKDAEGNNLFQGGYLGMDNISIFDRSKALPTGGHIDQADGTSWMAFFCMTMLQISLHLSLEEPSYQDISTKFFEHFLRIAGAMTSREKEGRSLWDETDGFFYDTLHLPNDTTVPLKVRSLVGLLPMLAVEVLQEEMLADLPTFSRRADWFVSKRPFIFKDHTCSLHSEGRKLLSLLSRERLISILKYMLDEEEFLSEYGIRSLSKFHEKNPFSFEAGGQAYTVGYTAAESDSFLFGGNSNWRGPIWFPINFLIIEALQKFHHYYGETLQVEFPTRSGHLMNLWDVSIELSKRLIRLFEQNPEGMRPFYGSAFKLQSDPDWKDLLLFHEYFHGDCGMGLGASHQTGWTALIAKLIQQTTQENPHAKPK
jgi:hypothetical protein